MKLEIELNDYLLAWYILYGASLSKEIDKFKKSLYVKFKNEYNFCYKDRSEIVKYGNDFIPDNDLLYNECFNSDLYKAIRKETLKYKNRLVKLWDNCENKVNETLSDVIKMAFPKVTKLFVIHPRFEIIDYVKENDSIIWGTNKDKYDAITIMLYCIVRGMIGDKKGYKEITNTVLELSVINEIGERLTDGHCYNIGDPRLKLIKKQIYPFWVMYLGFIQPSTILNKMIRDKVGFELDKYPIDKKLEKLNLDQFIDYCIKNNKQIIKYSNIETPKETIENIDDIDEI